MYRTKQDVDRHVTSVLARIKDEKERNARGYQIAKLYYEAKEYDIARRYLAGFLSIRENLPQAHRLMGLILEAGGQTAQAVASFKRSLELDDKQKDLVYKICEQYSKTNVDPERAKFWAEKGAKLFPNNEVIFKLKEKSVAGNGMENFKEMEGLISAELVKRPADVDLRVRLLKLYVSKGQVKEAYDHAIDIEQTLAYVDSLPWYEYLAELFKNYQLSPGCVNDATFSSHKLTALANLVSLSLLCKDVVESAEALHRFDQGLQEAVQLAQASAEWQALLTEMQGQFFYLAGTLLLKRAQRNQLTWRDATCVTSACYLASQQFPPLNSRSEWFVRAPSNKLKTNDRLLKISYFRCSQIGHMLNLMCRGERAQWSAGIKQRHCTPQGREKLYTTLFTLREMRNLKAQSFLSQSKAFCDFEICLPTAEQLSEFDSVGHLLKPESLHSLVWLALQHYSGKDPTQPAYEFSVFSTLQYSTSTSLEQASPETLCQLDVEAFLYATVRCTASQQLEARLILPQDGSQPDLLPAVLCKPLCTKEQAEWWGAAYKLYANIAKENFPKLRLVLQRGMETVRLMGNHGMSVTMIVHLAKTFDERASELKAKLERDTSLSGHLSALTARTAHYWSKALELLRKLEKNQLIRSPRERLFPDDSDRQMTATVVKQLIADGDFFTATKFMASQDYEAALECFERLEKPYASYHTAQIYKQLANNEIQGKTKDQITPALRSKYEALLIKARDAFYLTLDRLRGDKNHELNKLLSRDLDDIETRLSRADTDEGILNDSINLSVNSDDFESPMMMTGVQAMPSVTPGRLPYLAQSTPNVKPSLRSSLVAVLEEETARMSISEVVGRVRPSPERLEAQMRALTFSQETLMKTLMDRHEELVSNNKEIMEELRETRNINKQLQEQLAQANQNRMIGGPPYIPGALGQTMPTGPPYMMGSPLQAGGFPYPQQPNWMPQYGYQIPGQSPAAGIRLAASARLGPRHPINQGDFYSGASYSFANVDLDEEGLNHEDGDDPYHIDGEYYVDEGMANQAYNMPGMNEWPYGSRTGVEGKSTISYQPNMRPPGPQQGLAGTSLRGQSLQYGYRQPSPAHPMPGPGFFSSPQTHASMYPSNTPAEPTLAGALAANTSGLFGSPVTASPTGITGNSPAIPPNTAALQSGTGKQATPTTAVAKTQASGTASVTGQTAQYPVAATGQPSNTASVQRPVQSAASNLTQSFSLLFDGKATITANAKPPVFCTAKIFHLMSSNRPMIAIQASTENKETIMNHEFTADVQLQPQTFAPDTFIWTKTGSTDKFVLKFGDSSEASRFGLVVERVKQLLQSIVAAKEAAGPVTTAATGPGSNTATSVQRPEQSAASNLTESSSLLFDGKATITANAKPPVLCRAILVQLVRQNRPVIAMQAVTENKETVMNHEFTADVQVQPQMFVSDSFVWTKTGSTDKFILKFSDSNETARFTHAVERIKHYLQSIAAAKENTAASVTSANGQASVSQPSSAPPQKSLGSAAGMLSQLAAKHKDDTSQASPAAAPSQTSSDPTKPDASKNVFGGFTFKSTPVISTLEASPERQKAVPAKAVLSPAKPTAAKPFEGFSFSHMGSPAQSSPSGAAFGLIPKPSVQPAVAGSPGAARSPSSIGPVRGGRISQASPGRRDDDHVDEYEPNVDFQPVIPLPNLVEVKTGEEEEEKMFAERCKLYRFDNDLKQWKERGVGELKILRHQQSKKVRIIMRRDQVLKLCANHNLHCDMKLSKMASSDKSWCWNAVDFADEEVKNEQLAVRFKNKDLATIFKTVFEDCVAWLSTQSEKEVTSTEDLTQPIGEPADTNGTKQQQPSTEAEAKSDLKPLAEMFKPAEGSWECSSCLLRNGKDAKKCPACATLQPGVNPEDVEDEQSATTAFGATAGATGFKFGSAGGFSFGSSGFSFGTPSESTETASKPATTEGAGGFAFGKPKKDEDLKANAPSGFTFGKKTSQETSTQESKTSSDSSSGFVFGASKDAPQPTGKESTDGTQPSKESLKPLSEMFKRPEGAWECGTCMIVNKGEVLKCVACGTLKPGVKAEELKEVSSSSATSLSNVESSGFSFTPSSSNSASSGFTFGTSKSNSSSGFSFGTQSTGGNKPSGFSFGIVKPGESGSKTEQGSSLKDLLQSTSSTTDSPFTSMLAKTETPKSSASAESAVSKPEAEPKSLFSTATKSASDSFVFGSPLTKFTFTPSTPASSVKPSAITSPKSPEVDPHGHYVNKDGEDSHIFFEPVIKLPDKVELKTGEEEESVVFEHRAKLYRFDNSEWKERGLGVIKLLEHKQNHGLRVLMRREHILKICCNHRVTSDMELKAMPKAEGKAWIWQALDFADEEYKHERLAIRFKTPEIAAQFKEKFDKGREVAEKLSPSKSHGDTSTTKDSTPSGNVAALRNLFGDSKSSKPEGDDDDVIFVDELKASPNQIAMARKFKLPDNFYLYESSPPCPGCLGCVDGDRDKFAELLEKSPTAAHKNSPRKAESEKPDAVPLFGSVPVKQTESAPLPETESVSLFGNVAGTVSFAALAQNSDQAFVSKSDPNTPFSWSGAGSQLFGGGNAGKVGGPQGDEDEVAPSNDIHFEPIVSLPKISVKTGEEDDEVLFCQRSKLYRFDKDSKQWKERGTGDFKILKNKVTGGFRMLQRRQQVLKISCNHLLTSDLQLRPMSTSETSWCWTAMDFSDDEPEVQQFAIKFKNVTLAQEFKEKFESCQEEMRRKEAVTEAVQPSDSGEVEKGEDSVTQEETEEDEEDEEDDDEYEDVEEEDDDDDAPETLFEKRVTLSCIQDGKWKMLGMGDLKVQHDDDVGAYRILMKTDELEKICNHVICKETIVTSDQKRHCEWAAVDFSTDVPTKRQFKATFSSTPALEEFLVVFQQGKELAFESDVSEHSGTFPVEIIKPEVVSSPDGKHGAGLSSLGGV